MQFLLHVKGKDQGPLETRASLPAAEAVRGIGGRSGWRLLLADSAAAADRFACDVLSTHRDEPPSVILAHRHASETDFDAGLRLMELAKRARGGEILASEEFYSALDRPTRDTYGSAEPRGDEPLRPRFRDEPPAFVISPIGRIASEVRARADLVFDTLIKPACRQRGFRPERSDHMFTDQIREEMSRRLARDALVIAYLDCPPWNPNVMVEVGYRLQSGRPIVFLMDVEAKEPPFDLGDHQVIQIPVAQLGERVDEKLVEDLSRAIRDALKERIAPDDWPHPVASIRMRLGKEGHPVQEAYGGANQLFNRATVAGSHVAELIDGIRRFMPKAQFDSFADEQDKLIGKLIKIMQSGGDPGTVRATVPMFFATHPDPSINHRAFLPVIVSYRIDKRDSELGLQVLYLEVTASATVAKGGIVRCEVSNEGDRSALFWDLYAWSYDEILPRLSFYKTALERHFKALSGCRQVVEIGAGTGNLCRKLVEAGTNVTAVDRSRAMTDRMREKRRAMRMFVDRWCILQQSAEELAIVPDGYADGVSVLLSLFAMQRPGRALKEALRILKPGGVLVVTEPKASFDIRALLELAQRELEEDELSPDDEHWARVKDVNLVIAPSRERSWLTAEKIQGRLEAAGFTIASLEDSHHGHCATLVARAP